MKHQIFCFSNGISGCFLRAIAIADDGHVLAQHLCSSIGFMGHDLGITSDWKHENYNKHFGDGNWELEWVDEPKIHEGVQQAYKLNQELSRIEDVV